MEGMLPKLIYSVLLIGVLAILLHELCTVWFDPQVYIGRFEVVSEAGENLEADQAFAKRIIGARTCVVMPLAIRFRVLDRLRCCWAWVMALSCRALLC